MALMVVHDDIDGSTTIGGREGRSYMTQRNTTHNDSTATPCSFLCRPPQFDGLGRIVVQDPYGACAGTEEGDIVHFAAMIVIKGEGPICR